MIDESWYVRPEGFRERVGAGGMVARCAGEAVVVALVKEVELGDLGFVIPKGGVEPGETIASAALREITEETGITELEHVAELGALARQNFKKTYWQESHYGLYVTKQLGGAIPDPANYGLEWFGLDALPEMIWPDERELMEAKRDFVERAIRASW